MERISQKCWDLILGTLLGDGWLCKLDNRKNCYLGICHSIRQEYYLNHKFHILKEIGANKIITKKYISKQTGKEIYSKEFVTKSLSILTKLRKQLYKNNRKVVTKKYLDKLSDRSVAYWFMDDGSLVWHKRKRKIGKIYSTCKFYLAIYGRSKKEANIIQNWFNNRYNIRSKLRFHKPSNGYTLIFNRIDYLKIIPVIENYFIDSMKYKINMNKLGRKVD